MATDTGSIMADANTPGQPLSKSAQTRMDTDSASFMADTDAAPATEPTELTDAPGQPLSKSAQATDTGSTTADAPGQPLSKSAQKRLAKQTKWAAQRGARREKRKALRVRKREARAAARAAGEPVAPARKKPRAAEQTDVTVVLDCGFDELMNEREVVSLASQITRCYADNVAAAKRVRLVVAGFKTGTRLRQRFDGALQGHWRNWKGVRFCQEELGEVLHMLRAEVPQSAAEEKMKGEGEERREVEDKEEEKGDVEDAQILTAHAPSSEVYLSADSHHTLTALEPRGVYVVGALVDRNRHKNVCLHAAQAVGPPLGTARLPIGEYMRLSSRKVLATNHVVEILLGWLDGGDWGRAFGDVVPARKGGELIQRDGDGEDGHSGDDDDDDDSIPDDNPQEDSDKSPV